MFVIFFASALFLLLSEIIGITYGRILYLPINKADKLLIVVRTGLIRKQLILLISNLAI